MRPTDEQIRSIYPGLACGSLSAIQLAKLMELLNLIGIRMQLLPDWEPEAIADLKARHWDAVAEMYAELLAVME